LLSWSSLDSSHSSRRRRRHRRRRMTSGVHSRRGGGVVVNLCPEFVWTVVVVMVVEVAMPAVGLTR